MLHLFSFLLIKVPHHLVTVCICDIKVISFCCILTLISLLVYCWNYCIWQCQMCFINCQVIWRNFVCVLSVLFHGFLGSSYSMNVFSYSVIIKCIYAEKRCTQNLYCRCCNACDSLLETVVHVHLYRLYSWVPSLPSNCPLWDITLRDTSYG